MAIRTECRERSGGRRLGPVKGGVGVAISCSNGPSHFPWASPTWPLCFLQVTRTMSEAPRAFSLSVRLHYQGPADDDSRVD